MPPQQNPTTPNYDFIVNPTKPSGRGSPLGNSLKQRLALVVGGLLILIVIAVILAKALSGSSGWSSSFISIAQEQQALISLTGDVTGNSQAQLSASNSNVAATVALTVASSQSQLLAYLKTNGQKVSTARLGLKVRPQTAQQLTAAVTSGNYDSTFQSLLQTELNSYQLALKQAYAKAPGPKGRQLLSDEYNQAGLILTQVKQAGS